MEGQSEYDLRLMPVAAVDELANEGRNLVIVARVGTDLHIHIRIFDASGEKVVDKAENELVNGETLKALKTQLNLVSDKPGLSKEDKQSIIIHATSVAGHTSQSKGRKSALNIYLQDGGKIKNEREKKYSREEFSKKLGALSEKVGKPGVFNIQTQRITRIETRKNAELSLREAIAIAKALELKVGEIIAQEYHGLLEDTEVGTYAKLRHFANDEALYSYLCEVETGVRIGIFHNFPSSVYYIAEFGDVCQKAMERSQNIISKKLTSSECYTLKSLLSFAFCEVGKYTNEHRMMVIKKVIEAFEGDSRMHLCFFDSTGSKVGESFPNMEIIEDKSLLLVDMPIPSHPILEIKNKEIVKFIDKFFRDEKLFNHSVERGDAIHLLKILNECISKGKQSLTAFC